MTAQYKLVLQKSPQYEAFELPVRWYWLGIVKAWFYVQLHPWGEASLYRRKAT